MADLKQPPFGHLMLELILSFPLVAAVMAIYLGLGLKENSPIQWPEKLYRELWLMAVVIICTAVMGLCIFIDTPVLHAIFSPPPSAR